MKKILLSWLLALIAPFSFGQSYPSPTYHNLLVNGTFNSTGLVTCTSASSAVTWTGGSFGCNTAINASTLGGATFAAPGPIGSTTPGTGAFTTLTANTAVRGTNTTQVATTAFVQQEGLHYPQVGGTDFSTNTTITTSQLGGWGVVSATGLTITMPTLASSKAGQAFSFIGGQFGFTLAGNGTDTIVYNGALAANTVFIAPGESVIVTSNSASWYVTSGGVNSKAPGCMSIMAYGGNNGGSVDNSAAFAAAAAAGPAGQACVYFPPGNYAFSGTLTYTMPSNTASISVLGAGQDVTKLIWAAGGGMTVNFITDANSAHIRDLTFATGTTAAGSAVSLVQTAANTSFSYNGILSDVSNVTIRGNDGYQVSDYWNVGIYDFGISNVNFIGDDIVGRSALGGIGIEITGDANRIPVAFNVYGCQFSGLSYGFDYAPYTQGVSITSSNFTNVTRGVYAFGTGLDQLTITGSQFNAASINIDLETPVLQTMIYGNLILLQTNANGIYLNPSSSTSIVGNSFAPNPGATTTNGITFNGYNALSSVVTGNNFAQLTTGVNLTTNAKYVNVQANTYSGVTNTVINNCTTGCTVGVATQ